MAAVLELELEEEWEEPRVDPGSLDTGLEETRLPLSE